MTTEVCPSQADIDRYFAEYEEHDAARKQARELRDWEGETRHHQLALRAIGEAYKLTKLRRQIARDL